MAVTYVAARAITLHNVVYQPGDTIDTSNFAPGTLSEMIHLGWIAVFPSGTGGGAGTLAAMPATGTGSMSFYWANDDQGGTLYRDITSGSAYTKVAPGVGQIAGQELAYAEINANVTTAALGLVNRIDATGLIVTATVGSRPVLVEFFGSVFNTTINDGVGVQIVENVAGNANNTPLRQQTQMVSAGLASAIVPVNMKVRLNPAPGNYTWKVMFNATVGGTATISAAAAQPAFLRVTSG